MLATALIMALMLSVQVTPASAGILGTTFDYESLIDQYKPSLQYMYDEQYFPVDFYFDHDLNEENNKQNYQNHVGNWDTYVVFAHAKDNVWLYIQGVYYGPFIAIEYWYYYVADTGIEAHDQDWELHFEILIWQNTHQPFQARVGGHGYFLEGWRAWALIEKDNGHPKIYIDKTYSDLVNTVNYQKQFVKPVSKLLKKGGLLVYSTCTLTFEENEDVSIKFLNEGFTSIEIDIPYADKVYVGDLVAYRFHPLNYDMNGYYIAVFKKTS